MKIENTYIKKIFQTLGLRNSILRSRNSRFSAYGLACFITVASVVMFFAQGCEPDEFTERTNYEQLIGEYLQFHPEEFSTFYKVMEKSGTVAFLKAYGAYTVFAPTNEAFDKYFESKGKSSLDDFSAEELKDLVRYHTIADTITTPLFIDGKLQTPTMYGQYLTSKVSFEGGDAVYKINKYANMVSKDKRLLNGIIHSVETVLDPVTSTLAEMIAKNPELTIFNQALLETGYDSILNLRVEKGEEDPRWFTVVAVSNNAYAKDGIKSYNDLKAKYSDTGNAKNPKDSLNLYVAYHCLGNQLKYVSDLQSSASHITMAPLEVITIKTVNGVVKVNEDIFNGEVEPGYAINREVSDNTANNGVMHFSEEDYTIKFRLPFPVYWEVTDQLEIRKIPGIYGKQGTELVSGQLKDIIWPEGNSIWYGVGQLNGAQPVNSDFLDIYLRPEVVPWIEFKTPILVKGRYKVWVCTRNRYPSSGRRNPIFFVYFNDDVLPVVIDSNITLNRESSEEEYELQGLKWFTFRPSSDSLEYRHINKKDAETMIGQLAGTIEVKTTGNHKIKFVGISAYAGQTLWLDQIQFIPTDMDQLWPRRNTDDNSDVYKAGLPIVVAPE